MTVSLQKGGNVSLTKEAGGTLGKVTVGLGWDAKGATAGAEFDLDASAAALGPDNKELAKGWFVFFNQLTSPDGSIAHSGDNLTGAGDGDDEQIVIDLAAVPPTVDKIKLLVTIYEAGKRNQNFGQVSNAFVRIVDQNDGKELARYDLGEDYALETAVIFGELYRKDGEWKFKAVGSAYSDGLEGFAKEHAVDLS